MKELIRKTIIKIQMDNKSIDDQKDTLHSYGKPARESFSYAMLELHKAVNEFKISVLKALIGE